MKLLVYFILLPGLLQAQPGIWTWVNGDTTDFVPPVYGIQGIPDPQNHPCGGYEGCEWTDLDGKFWYFASKTCGGWGNDLWMYDPTIEMWTWVKGPGVPNDTGNYGLLGVPDDNNIPPCRGFAMATWVDSLGDLWLYGGFNNVNFNESDNTFNDLWRYNIASNQWTWMSGSDIPNQNPVWGEKGMPEPENSPGKRSEVVGTWVDNSNNLYLFGGHRGESSSLASNDLWRYSIDDNLWTWLKGDSTENSVGLYGVQGEEDPLNNPSARFAYSFWNDDAGNFWMFGGKRYGGGASYLNDLWKYNVQTNNWTWVKGPADELADQGVVGEVCEIGNQFNPANRFENRACWKDSSGHLWLYGGRGEGPPEATMPSHLNDVWRYRIEENDWTLMWADTSMNLGPVYGNIGVSSPCTHPGGTMGGVAWYDHVANSVYVFGGREHSPPGNFTDIRSTMWKFELPDPCITYEPCINPCFSTPCDADLNGNSQVETLDLLMFLTEMYCTESCAGDFNCDELVNVEDLLFFLAAFGIQC